MNRGEYQELLRLVDKLGEEIEQTPDEGQPRDHGSRPLRDFYLPRVPKNFYYDSAVFRRLLGTR